MANPLVVKDFDSSRVKHVYSGRVGCMCGCKGKHHYTQDAKGPGYDVKRSNVSVTRVARNMKEWAAMNGVPMYLDLDAKCIYAESQDLDRHYVAYFQ